MMGARAGGENVFRRISVLGDPNCSVIPELQRWVNEGKSLGKWELQLIIKQLRKYSRYQHALQISEWMDSCGRYRSSLSDCAIRLDLIAKVRGIACAENYFDNLPKVAKIQPTYGALLNSYVREKLMEKAEVHMKKMEELGYATTTLPYNELLTLYKNTGKFEKVSLVIQEMEKNNISQDKFTYNIRMNICAAISDIDGVDKILEEMQCNPMVDIDWSTNGNLANIYIKAGLLDKAELTLKEMENKMDRRDREAFNFLITLCASAGNKDGVARMWHLLKLSFPKLTNMSFICMLTSLLKLGDLEGAENIFKEWQSSGLTYDFRVPNILLDAYVKKGLMEKAELVLEHVLEGTEKPISKTWEIIAEGYLMNTQIDKAVYAMNKALLSMERGGWQPKPTNLLFILKHLQEHGDVVCAEQYLKILRDMNIESKEIIRSGFQATEATPI